MKSRTILLAFTCTFAAQIAVAARADDPPAKAKRPDIYDKTADGAKQIATALAEAKRDNKRVILQFGANWCGWCHKLHDLFKSNKDIAHELLYEYVVVLVDVDKIDGQTHNQTTAEKYGNPTKLGLPALVVLDSEGKQLTTQDTGKLEEGDHHSPDKVLDFLKKWKPTPIAADDALSAGLARGKAESKAVFVDFSAPWCGWCHKLDAYLNREEIAKVFDSAFVTVKIDIDRMPGGKTMDEKFRGSKQGGIPFFVILDAAGKKLADANGPDGNIGFPAQPVEIAHFMKAVHQTAPKLTDAQLAILENGLKASAVQVRADH